VYDAAFGYEVFSSKMLWKNGLPQSFAEVHFIILIVTK